jgi:biotin operon repressor
MADQQQFTFAMDPVGALELLIGHLLFGGGAAAPLTGNERALLAILRYHKGVGNARKLEELAAQLKVSPREVKQLAKTLTEQHGVPIGARRQPPYGYFLCVTPDDYAAARRPYLNEVLSLLRRLKALNPDQRLLELYGQLELAIQQERP